MSGENTMAKTHKDQRNNVNTMTRTLSRGPQAKAKSIYSADQELIRTDLYSGISPKLRRFWKTVVAGGG